MQRVNRRQPGVGCKCMGTRNSTVGWPRSGRRAEISCWTCSTTSPYTVPDATFLVGDVSNAKREAPVELGERKIEEVVQENLGWSGENQVAKEGELEATRRSLENRPRMETS